MNQDKDKIKIITGGYLGNNQYMIQQVTKKLEESGVEVEMVEEPKQ